MTRLAYLATTVCSVLVLVGCAEVPETDAELATEDVVTDDAKLDSSTWSGTPTLHTGVKVFDRADAQGRRVHPLWLAGSPGAPVAIDVRADAVEGDDVRVVVLGPLVDGTRAVLGADGYSSRKTSAAVAITTEATGEHLVVVGSYRLASETGYELVARCTDCGARADILATPKLGALVGASDRLLQAQLGEVLANRTFDVELELWASPPMQTWNAELVATSVASGNQVNAIVPDSVRPGDDLTLVVREAGGKVLDSGIVTRFAPASGAFARTDAILYGDIASLQIAGVVGYFEGSADLVLRSETRNVEVAQHFIHADLPGQLGNGLNSFDATFAPEIVDEHGDLNPNLPRNGELMSVGFLNGNGDVVRLGCFQYCNDLSSMETCTGGPRSCP